MTSLESLIEDVLFANDDDAARRACQAIYALGQKETGIEEDPKESIGHLLTVLRGKMQTFEMLQDEQNHREAWDDMLEYLKTWIEEDRANRK